VRDFPSALIGGVIANLLSANPKLTPRQIIFLPLFNSSYQNFRDISHILVRSAKKNLGSSEEWDMNGANLLHHPTFGYEFTHSFWLVFS
jgi:hypothetical protein